MDANFRPAPGKKTREYALYLKALWHQVSQSGIDGNEPGSIGKSCAQKSQASYTRLAHGRAVHVNAVPFRHLQLKHIRADKRNLAVRHVPPGQLVRKVHVHLNLFYPQNLTAIAIRQPQAVAPRTTSQLNKTIARRQVQAPCYRSQSGQGGFSITLCIFLTPTIEKSPTDNPGVAQQVQQFAMNFSPQKPNRPTLAQADSRQHQFNNQGSEPPVQAVFTGIFPVHV